MKVALSNIRKFKANGAGGRDIVTKYFSRENTNKRVAELLEALVAKRKK